MADVALTSLGGLACMVLMCGVAMWLVPRLFRRLPVLRRVAARVRSQSAIDRMISWVEDEQPDLRRAEAPDGTVTVLFSDIEDSTRITERLGDKRWLELLEVTMRSCASTSAATADMRSSPKATGSCSRSPARARRLRARSTSSARSRAAPPAASCRSACGWAFITGEAIQRDGDFYGRSVILAARIADRAHGDEILVSSLVRELLQPAHEVVVKEADEVELKGLDGRHRLYVSSGERRRHFTSPTAGRHAPYLVHRRRAG